MPGFEGVYQASTHGRVRSLDRRVTQLSRWGKPVERLQRGRVLKTTIDPDGYTVHSVAKTSEPLPSRRVHVIVALAFHGRPPEGFQPDHLDRDKTNNSPGNLAWVHALENNRRAVRSTKPRTSRPVALIRDLAVLEFDSLNQAVCYLGCNTHVLRRALDSPTRSAYGHKVFSL